MRVPVPAVSNRWSNERRSRGTRTSVTYRCGAETVRRGDERHGERDRRSPPVADPAQGSSSERAVEAGVNDLVRPLGPATHVRIGSPDAIDRQL